MGILTKEQWGSIHKAMMRRRKEMREAGEAAQREFYRKFGIDSHANEKIGSVPQALQGIE